MLTPSDIVAAKLLVQLGDLDAETVRGHLRLVAEAATAQVDLVARAAQAGQLDKAQIKRIRQYVALFEHVRHEAVYLRELERRHSLPEDEVSELIARIELSAYRRRIGHVLVDMQRLSLKEAVDLESRTRQLTHEEDVQVLRRYRGEDYQGVARPLIPRAVVDPSVFRLSVLFRSRETHARVSRALLRLRLGEQPPEEEQAELEAAREAQQVYTPGPVYTVPVHGDEAGEDDTTAVFGSSRFRAKGDENQELRSLRLIGDYAVIECLGQGGMGAVYLAQEEGGTGPLVAVKVMHSKLAAPEDLARFDREAHICSLLDHPNAVKLLGRGMTEDALAYLVMPFYAGKTLRALLQERGALDLPLAFDLFEQLLEGVAAIHEVGVVHRDLKPENVFLLAGVPPEVRIVDLGIARVMDDDLPEESRQFRTLPGIISGSPAYIAPETITDEDVDGRTDLYSLGVLLFQMLTGRLPLSAGTAYEYLREHLVGVPLSLNQARPEVLWAPELEELVASLLAKEREDRPESSGTVLHLLRSGLREHSLSVARQTSEAPTRRGLFNDFFKMLGGGGS